MDEMELHQEVRFAAVLYGGLSLAIYINGVTQELFRMVRATAPDPDDPSRARFEPAGTESVYRRLGKALGNPARMPGAPEDKNAKIHTRFVVDLISGTSAGGINGVFLGKALALGGNLDELKKLWMTEANIDLLINDKESLVSLPKRIGHQDPPQGLLNGQRMYHVLNRALRGVDDNAARGPMVDELDLFVTTTDVRGLILPIQLSDTRVFERRHRTVFNFQFQSKDVNPAGRNDFGATFTPFLAFAARCTSAFPVAFEPMKLTDIVPILGDPRVKVDVPDWEPLYGDYLRETGVVSVPFPERSFADGGSLDNKPFSFVIDQMVDRRADLPVDRKLLYVEPDPEHPEEALETNGRPDAVENAMAGLSLPRHETIRQDLHRVVERNEEIRRVRSLLRFIEKSASQVSEAGSPGDQAMKLRPGEWVTLDTNDLFRRFGRCYLTYHRLKISTVTDDLATALYQHYQLDTQSVYAKGLRKLVEAWRDAEYGQATKVAGIDGTEVEKGDRYNQFLMDFDVSYRLRRLRHLRRCIDDLYSSPPKELGRTSVQPEDLRTELGAISHSLLEPSRKLRSLKPDPKVTRPFGSFNDLQAALSGSRDATEILKEPAIRELIAGVANGLARDYREAFDKSGQLIIEALDPSKAGNPTAKAVRAMLREAYGGYEKQDAITFPILHRSALGELDEVDVLRISPADATQLVNERAGDPKKLKGTLLHAFGGFFDLQWRENDMMWGRLDGAERIISALLPPVIENGKDLNAELRNRLVGDAHDIILEEELGDKAHVLQATHGAAFAPREKLEVHRNLLRNEPERTLSARAMARGTTLLGGILHHVSKERRIDQRPGALLTRVGQVACGLVQAAVPGSLSTLVFKHWVSILILAALPLLLIGGLEPIGIRLLLLVASVALAVLLIRDYLLYSGKVAVTMAGLVALGLVALAAIGAVEVANLFGSERNFGDIGIPSLTPGLAWVGRVTGLAGLITVIVGLWMTFRARRLEYPRGHAPKPPILALELVETVGDVERVAGDSWHTNRNIFRAIQDADTWFIAGYMATLAGLGAVFCLADLPTPGLLAALGVGTAAAGVAGGLFDRIENKRINEILGLSLRQLSKADAIQHDGALPVDVVTPALRKWGLVFVALLAAGAGFLMSGHWATQLLVGAPAMLTGAAGLVGVVSQKHRTRLIAGGMSVMFLLLLPITCLLLFRSGWLLRALGAGG